MSNMHSANPDILSGKDVAQFLNVSINTVYYWAASGTGPPSAKIGKHRRYRRSDLEAWVNTKFDQDAAAR